MSASIGAVTEDELHALRANAERGVARYPDDKVPVPGAELLRLLATIGARDAEIERLRGEVAESHKLDDEVRAGLAWLDGLVEGASCAFCAPSKLTPEALARAQEHMRTCDKHPLAAAEARVRVLESVVDAAKAMIEKTANANGEVYAVECAAWDALHDALRPFLPPPDPEMVF